MAARWPGGVIVTDLGAPDTFDGRTLLVTGGGSGMGAATARLFAARGGQVALLDLRVEAAQAVADEIPGSLAVAADVSDEASVRAAVVAVDERFGRIDCLVNAAGHHVGGPLAEWSYAEFNRMLAVHVGGVFLMCQQALPVMLRNGGGAIVNIASIAAFIAQRSNAPYGAAKGAVLSFSRQLALEVAPQVRVNVVAPGRTRTAMTEQLIIERGDGDLERGLEVTRNMTPMHHICQPWEMAEAICFLLSDRTPFITGTSLLVDGGETAA
jgi:NAD(P)-dependent dehydrogenase (short-subunit alcohol dehydrogenase family)